MCFHQWKLSISSLAEFFYIKKGEKEKSLFSSDLYLQTEKGNDTFNKKTVSSRRVSSTTLQSHRKDVPIILTVAPTLNRKTAPWKYTETTKKAREYILKEKDTRCSSLPLPFGDYYDAIERRLGARVCSRHFREFKGSRLALMIWQSASGQEELVRNTMIGHSTTLLRGLLH